MSVIYFFLLFITSSYVSATAPDPNNPYRSFIPANNNARYRVCGSGVRWQIGETAATCGGPAVYATHGYYWGRQWPGPDSCVCECFGGITASDPYCCQTTMPGFTGPGCTQRTCVSDFETGEECNGRGYCDRSTNTCVCEPGYGTYAKQSYTSSGMSSAYAPGDVCQATTCSPAGHGDTGCSNGGTCVNEATEQNMFIVNINGGPSPPRIATFSSYVNMHCANCPSGWGGPYCSDRTCIAPGTNTLCSGRTFDTDPLYHVIATAICVDNICHCEGYRLPFCDVFTCETSDGNLCRNRGTCVLNAGVPSACDCASGYYGEGCQVKSCYYPLSTTGIECRNHGTCLGEGVCQCDATHCGADCAHACNCNQATGAESVCSCNDFGGAVSCGTCGTGFGGQYCCPITNGLVCNGGTCGAGGVCTCAACAGTASCNTVLGTCNACPSGFGGLHCCKLTAGVVCNGGTCGVGGVCTCKTVFGGLICGGTGTCNTADGTCTCPQPNSISISTCAATTIYEGNTCCPFASNGLGGREVCGGPTRGTCTASGCQCNAGYSGAYCCATCGPHGTCTPTGCCCNAGFSGGLCNINSVCPTSVVGQLCSGQGICITEPTWYIASSALWLGAPPNITYWDFDVGRLNYDTIGNNDVVMDGITYTNWYGSITLWIKLHQAFYDYDPRPTTSPTFWAEFDKYWNPQSGPSPVVIGDGASVLRFVMSPEYESAVYAYRGTIASRAWALRGLKFFQPDVLVPDQLYMNHAAQLMLTPNTTALWWAHRVLGIMHVMQYLNRVDWTTSTNPALIPFEPPERCVCNAVATGSTVTPYAWLSPRSDTTVDCSNGCTTTTPNYGAVSPTPNCTTGCPYSTLTEFNKLYDTACVGQYKGEWHGGCNRITKKCVCGSRWTGVACDIPFSSNCFSNVTYALPLCSGRGTCTPPATACTCNDINTGPLCEIFVCSADKPLLSQRTTQCNGMGVCKPDRNCTCDVATQLDASRGEATPRPFLPIGSNCDVNGAAVCASYANGVWLECSGHGTCSLSSSTGTAVCVCANGWSGATCSLSQCGTGCNANQTCNAATGVCSCLGPRITPSGCSDPSCVCSANTCIHSSLAAGATACGDCIIPYKRDTSGSCTLIQCPLVMITDDGERACTSSDPLCVPGMDSHSKQCCTDACGSNCFLNSTGSRHCSCLDASYLPASTQTDGVCHTVCHGHPALLYGDPLVAHCVCQTNYFLFPPFNSTIDRMSATCERLRCMNGGRYINTQCTCPIGYSGSLCQVYTPPEVVIAPSSSSSSSMALIIYSSSSSALSSSSSSSSSSGAVSSSLSSVSQLLSSSSSSSSSSSLPSPLASSTGSDTGSSTLTSTATATSAAFRPYFSHHIYLYCICFVASFQFV